MLRVLSNIALSSLLVVTLLWGGCVSCEQFFMFPGIGSKCCNKSGKCEKPGKSQPKTDCNRMPLAVQGGSHMDMAPPPVVVALATSEPQPVVRFEAADQEMIREHSPPDLQVLNSTFLL
jgi:hypothetical protein